MKSSNASSSASGASTSSSGFQYVWYAWAWRSSGYFMSTKLRMRSAALRSLPVEFMDSNMSCALSRPCAMVTDTTSSRRSPSHTVATFASASSRRSKSARLSRIREGPSGAGRDGSSRWSITALNVARSPLDSVSL